MLDVRRREFITLLGGTATWPLTARAQQIAMPVIGSLYGVSAAEWAEPMTGFRRGLSESGFVEGRNVAIEYRWADGQFDRMPAMAADLVSRKVAVILVGGNLDGVRAAIAATQTIPIVFTTASNPVATGLVASLNRPGANATGVTVIAAELGPKRLELLHEVLPTAKKIALLVNPKVPRVLQDDIQDAQAAAGGLGLEIIVVKGGSEDEIETAFATATQQRASALQVGDDAFLDSRRAQIAALGLRYALPTIALTRRAVAAGSLMSYGSNQMDVYRQAGIYVGRILKGEKPADLPVLQPTKFELVINLKTAKALGLTVPAMLLARADEVIE
jgi:putative tryptophan/tyrosine transport system substrate-binding protein